MMPGGPVRSRRERIAVQVIDQLCRHLREHNYNRQVRSFRAPAERAVANLKAWRFLKRFLYVASVYLVLGFWAATVAAPGTLEGMLCMRPFITPEVHLRVQPEIILQGLGLALFVSGAMMEPPEKAPSQGIS